MNIENSGNGLESEEPEGNERYSKLRIAGGLTVEQIAPQGIRAIGMRCGFIRGLDSLSLEEAADEEGEEIFPVNLQLKAVEGEVAYHALLYIDQKIEDAPWFVVDFDGYEQEVQATYRCFDGRETSIAVVGYRHTDREDPRFEVVHSLIKAAFRDYFSRQPTITEAGMEVEFVAAGQKSGSWSFSERLL